MFGIEFYRREIFLRGFPKRNIRVFRKTFNKMIALMCALIMVDTICVYGEDLSYAGSISLWDYCVNDEKDFPNNPVHEKFHKVRDAWKDEHPNITLKETAYESSRYHSDITALATMGRLPDIFVVPCSWIMYLAQSNLILNLSEQLESSGSLEVFEPEALRSFQYGAEYYAWPFLAQSGPVVLYDRTVFKGDSVEQSSFPGTWDEVEEFELIGNNKKSEYAAILGFPAVGGSQISSSLLSTLFPRFIDEEWFDHMLNGDRETSFLENGFCESLDYIRSLYGKGIFGEDCNQMTSDSIADAFLEREYPAVLLSLNDAAKLIQTMKEEQEELNNQKINGQGKDKSEENTLKLADIGMAPVPSADSIGQNSQPFGYGCGLVISSAVEYDPLKLAACIDFCESVTGVDYNNSLFSVFDVPEHPEVSLSSKIAEEIFENHYRLWTSYFNAGTWSSINSVLGDYTDEESELTTDEAVNSIQDGYERYYLMILPSE